MVVSMKVIGAKIKQMEEVVSYMRMEIYMMVSGRMIKHMDMVSTHILMEHNMKEIG